MKKNFALAVVACVLVLTSCSKKAETSNEHDHNAHATEATTETTEAVEENVASADNTVKEITIKGGDDMKFDVTSINATAGQTIKLTLTHSGKLPKASMGHNLVILKSGVNVEEFATKAMAARDNDYIPASASGDIVAHTSLVGGGESSTIEFTAPDRGVYEFICTFPGHSAMMKGKLIVK